MQLPSYSWWQPVLPEHTSRVKQLKLPVNSSLSFAGQAMLPCRHMSRQHTHETPVTHLQDLHQAALPCSRLAQAAKTAAHTVTQLQAGADMDPIRADSTYTAHTAMT